MTSMNTCFECRLPVLGLRGQDTELDTFYLGASDQEILEAEAYGSCHLICLATGKWAERWVAAIRRNFEQERRFVLLDSAPNWIYQVPTTKELVVVYPTGRREFLSRQVVKAMKAGDSTMNVVEPGMVEFDATVREHVASKGQGDLAWLLDELGTRHLLWEPRSVEGGRFRVTGSDSRGLELELAYDVEFGHDVAAQVRRGGW